LTGGNTIVIPVSRDRRGLRGGIDGAVDVLLREKKCIEKRI
jgi:hypothetical protein